MDGSRKRLVTLGVLVAILVAVTWREKSSPMVPAAEPGAAAAQGVGAETSARARAVRQVPPVGLTRLGRGAPEPSDTGRDPFRFSTSAGGRGGSALAQPTALPPVVRSAAPPVQAGPLPPPPIPLKFIGVIARKDGRKIAMVTDGRGVYYGAEGAVIEGQYRIVRIGQDTIEMTYLDGRGRRTIPLSGG